MWSDEAPTEDGWYWLKQRNCKWMTTAEMSNDSWEMQDCNVSMEWVCKHYQFGPRIPTPEELEDTAYVLSRLIEEVIDAGWHPSHVEDAVEIVKRIRKGGDA